VAFSSANFDQKTAHLPSGRRVIDSRPLSVPQRGFASHNNLEGRNCRASHLALGNGFVSLKQRAAKAADNAGCTPPQRPRPKFCSARKTLLEQQCCIDTHTTIKTMQIGWLVEMPAHILCAGSFGADVWTQTACAISSCRQYAEYEEQERGSAAWCILACRILPRAVLILGVTSLS